MTKKNIRSNKAKVVTQKKKLKSQGGSIASDLVNKLTEKSSCNLKTNSMNNKVDMIDRMNIISNYGSSYKTTGGMRIPKRKIFKGGSVASDLVNQLTSSSNCQKLPSSVTNILTKDLIVPNYGTSYKTTGGGKKKTSKKFQRGFIQKTISNLKKYLENKQPFTTLVNNVKNYWNKNLNFKLSTENAKTIINNLFNSNFSVTSKNKKQFNVSKNGGARVVLPRRWFDPNYNDTYVTQQSNCSNCPTARTLPANYESYNYYTHPNQSCLAGGGGYFNAKLNSTADTMGTGDRVRGDSTWMGSTNPENISQNYKNEMYGVTTTFKPGRGNITVSEAHNFCNSTNCAPEPRSSLLVNPNVTLKNINTDSLYSPADFTTGVVWPRSVAQPIGDFGSSGLPIPNQRAGNKKKTLRKSKKSQK